MNRLIAYYVFDFEHFTIEWDGIEIPIKLKMRSKDFYS